MLNCYFVLFLVITEREGTKKTIVQNVIITKKSTILMSYAYAYVENKYNHLRFNSEVF